MTDKELIRQEIERLKGKVDDVSSYSNGWQQALRMIEIFIDSLPEESGCEVNFTTKSEDLKEEIERWIKKKHFIFTEIDEIIETASHFAEWQKQKDQEIIELAEDHAMLAGMNKMKEEMMKDAVEGVVHHFPHDELAAVHYNDPKGTPMSIYVSSKGLSAGDRVKIIIVKEKEEKR